MALNKFNQPNPVFPGRGLRGKLAFFKKAGFPLIMHFNHHNLGWGVWGETFSKVFTQKLA
jgi:hypothetical protein